LQTGDGNHRNQGILESVTEVNRPRRQSARPREADVVGAQDLEHFSPNQPHDQRHLEQAERNRGHDQSLEAGNSQQPRGPPADPHDVPAAK
jgi:hypothetical protein